ncbi:MAG: hypothetical protein A4S09_04325 [Proteobacteria bacterium SG_bin7]|nr:MAG: hypothetical protein A4S09_04325 [Proteobacteria bacterium SG_bin7]
MNDIIYCTLDPNSPFEIRRAAEIHEHSPLNWDANWPVNQTQIDKLTESLKAKSIDPNVLFLLTLS